MSVDLRPYAERLAKAMPSRFDFVESHILRPHWHIEDSVRTDGKCPRFIATDSCGENQAWAFFGPLMDEFDVRPHGLGKAGHPGTLVFDGRLPWLESVAEAVCQEVERRVGGERHEQD